LNIGGKRYTTTQATLLKYKGSFFESLIQNAQDNSEFFVDRNYDLFEYVLEHLRTGKVYQIIPDTLRAAILAEFAFYSIPIPVFERCIVDVNPQFVTYGSGVCLQHVVTQRYLHFADNFSTKFVSSSGQSIPSTVSEIDSNCLWIVKGPHSDTDPYNFTPTIVQKGDVIRLGHYKTRHNLHSHVGYSSAVTKQQEVTCYGKDGQGDGNDNFKVDVDGGGMVWGINSKIRLIHVLSNCALHSHATPLDADNNEVTGFSARDENDMWRVIFLDRIYL